MARRITRLKFGQEVKYLSRQMIVVDVYSHIAYLKDKDTREVICVNLGDLVIANIEPSMVSIG